MYFAPVSTAFLSFAVKCVCLLGEVYCCLVLLGYLLLSFMFNPWALLFYIVCLLFCFGFLFLLSFPLDRSRASNILSFSISKARFPNWVLHFFIHFLVRVVFLDGLFLPLSRRVTHFLFVRNKRLWKKLSFFLCFCSGNSESQHFYLISVTLRNLFSWILYTIFSEPIYRLSFFLYSFCLLLVVELLLRFLHQNVLAKRLNGLNIFVCSGFCMRFF